MTELEMKLIERLNASQSAMDSCIHSMKEQGLNLEETDFYLELAGELAPNEELLKTLDYPTKKYARKCSATGEGMNEGFCYGEGQEYFKYEKDLIKFLREGESEDFNSVSDEFILKEAYDCGEYYYTEWEDESDFQYVMSNGKLVEIDV